MWRRPTTLAIALAASCFAFEGAADSQFALHASKTKRRNVRQPNRTVPNAIHPKIRQGEKWGEPCSLKVCRQYSHGNMYVLETYDGVGHRLANFLNGLALAHKFKMGFGGVIRAPNTPKKSDHGIDFHDVLDGIFGPGAADELMFRTDQFMTQTLEYLDMKLHYPFDMKFRDEEDFAKRFVEIDEEDHIYVPIVALHNGKTLDGYFPEELQNSVREQLDEMPLVYKPGRKSVAIHVRRGDLPKGDSRVTTDAYYFRLLEAILQVEPDADVHMWSSTTGDRRHTTRDNLWTSEDFDGFRSRGVTVHLDDEDLLSPWAHMSRADMLVTSMSYFSYSPAVMSRGCIIYPGYPVYEGHRTEVPSNWINAQTIEGLEAKPDYVPYVEDEDDHHMDHPMEMQRHRMKMHMQAKANADGEVEVVAFDSNSDATEFQRQLRECLKRTPGANI